MLKAKQRYKIYLEIADVWFGTHSTHQPGWSFLWIGIYMTFQEKMIC